jgi:hypothetical protein
LEGGTFDDQDVVALSIPPSAKACSYKRIKAYGSHFRVDDQTSVTCVTYDSEVASFLATTMLMTITILRDNYNM